MITISMLNTKKKGRGLISTYIYVREISSSVDKRKLELGYQAARPGIMGIAKSRAE